MLRQLLSFELRGLSGVRWRAACTLAAVAGIAGLACAPGCGSFASSSDRLDPEERRPSPPGASACPPGGASARCPAGPAFVATMSMPALALPDASTGAEAPRDAGAPDAAAPDTPPRDGGAGHACDGAGEFLDATGLVCYLRGEQSVAWAEAQQACVAWGGVLVRIDSADEGTLLESQLLADSWIGASDLDAEGQFTWSDGGELAFSNWADAQPDDFGQAEDCVELLLRDGRWNDQQCSEPRAYFCQRDMSETQPD